MRKIQRRDFLKAMGLTTAALSLTACGGSGAASASSVSSAPASGSSAPAASAQPEAAGEKAAPTGALVAQFKTGELTIGEYTFKAQYIPFDVRREVGGAYHVINADSYRGNYFFSFYNEDDEKQSAKIFEYAIKDDRLTPVEEYNIDGSNALSIDRNGILYAMDTFDVYCYDLNGSDPEEPGDALDYSGSCYSSKDRDLTVIYWTDSAPVLVQDGEYTELILEGDNEIGPFCSMSSLNLSGDELLTVGEPDSSGDYYFAAFDLDGLRMYFSISNKLLKNEPGFDLYVTKDGENYTELTLNGFHDKFNFGGRTLVANEDGLYIGTANPFYGAQVWRITEVEEDAPNSIVEFFAKIVRFFQTIIEWFRGLFQ